MATLNPDKLAQHYGLGDEAPTDGTHVEYAEYDDEDDVVEVAQPVSEQDAPSRFRKLKTLLALGAIIASPIVVTEAAHLMGNQEHAPWQHHTPTKTHNP